MRWGQALAALGPASLQNQPAILGRHPSAKTMRLSPSSIIRLKCWLRHKSLNLLVNENGKTSGQTCLCQERA